MNRRQLLQWTGLLAANAAVSPLTVEAKDTPKAK
jgi:hypothetical protein